jgi:hypothetical protein
MREQERVGGFIPDRSKNASLERRRLIRMTLQAERAGYVHVAAELRELDSELFEVVEDAPTAWR